MYDTFDLGGFHIMVLDCFYNITAYWDTM